MRLLTLALTFVTQCGVIAMDRFQPDPAAVGAYAAAAATANLVVVLATATNRFYSPRLSMLLEQRRSVYLEAKRIEDSLAQEVRLQERLAAEFAAQYQEALELDLEDPFAPEAGADV